MNSGMLTQWTTIQQWKGNKQLLHATTWVILSNTMLIKMLNEKNTWFHLYKVWKQVKLVMVLEN